MTNRTKQEKYGKWKKKLAISIAILHVKKESDVPKNTTELTRKSRTTNRTIQYMKQLGERERERERGGGGEDRQTDRQTDRDSQTDRQTERRADRDRQADRRTDRQTEKEADRDR